MIYLDIIIFYRRGVTKDSQSKGFIDHAYADLIWSNTLDFFLEDYNLFT